LTPDILLVYVILVVSVVLLATEWIALEVTALLCLGILALTGLVSPVEALSGFSNPAVVTIWAVFILSGGLTKTGVAKVIGDVVLKLAGKGEASMIVVIMTTAGVLSAVMNNVAVAALMLPVVMDIARRTGRSPSRLLMPLAYGCLLGGLTTQIGTPPNILVSDALREAGFKPFSFFDYTPVGAIVMVTGIAFMALVGRHLLPKHAPDGADAGPQSDWQSRYGVCERLFYVRVPEDSRLAGKSLGQVRLGSILGWNVLAVSRGRRITALPGPSDVLQPGDLLIVEGREDATEKLHSWRNLEVEEEGIDLEMVYSGDTALARFVLGRDSSLVGSTLNLLGFRDRYGCNVLAVRRNGEILRCNLADEPLRQGDRLLVAGRKDRLELLAREEGIEEFEAVDRSEVIRNWGLHERLMVVRVPEDSGLVGETLRESRLGDALNNRILGILRDDDSLVLPEPDEILQPGDRLVVEGRLRDLDLLKGLEELVVDRENRPDVHKIFNEHVGRVEAVLSPRTSLEGKTLRQINFREKFGLSVLALWRRGKVLRSDLRDVELRFGDSLLLMGELKKIHMLAREEDFIVLTESAQEELRMEKMTHALAILALVLTPVIIGWVPIYIAAVIGAALMVLTGCLTMDEAYRQIEWKAVFLIAGLLPLGNALHATGAAQLIAEGVVAVAGPFGPMAVMFGLISLTFMFTCFVPTAALVVLMAPIVFGTTAGMGLPPYGMIMAIAMAASASFMTPVAHPANIMVMGPGGYRFRDYMLIGGLLTLVTLGVLMLVLPIFWPLHG
jgi:di/tricarboxylate transporter